MEEVFHNGYEGQNRRKENGNSPFIKVMKDKLGESKTEKVPHRGYEGQNQVNQRANCSS